MPASADTGPKLPVPPLVLIEKFSAASEDETERYDPSSMSFYELAITPESSAVGRRISKLGLKFLPGQCNWIHQ